ncbi:hypothetical protein OIV83_004747 [Microbotryomycetes sp. JL201]|nr:hypothetical protein OIV83_004747 [Microbotryomycetes sp. JL201]
MSHGSLYTDSFERARPNATFEAVQQRITIVRAVTTDLAAYYHERAQAEETYTKALNKLAARLRDTSGSNGVWTAVGELGLDRNEQRQQLGAWHPVLNRLEQELKDTAASHDSWRKKTLDDVEAALRSSLGQPQWQRWSQAQAQLVSTVKEYDSQLDKVHKNQGKATTSGKATSKLLTAQSQLATLGSSLTSALPAFLSQSQSLEEAHVTLLKEKLVVAGTASSDLGRERMEMGERLLNSVLGVDEQVEMQTWALRESMRAGSQTGPAGDSQTGPGTALSEFGTTSVREDSIMEEPMAQPSRPVPPASRVTQPTGQSRTNPAPPPAPLPLPTPSTTPSKSGGRGLKSLFKRDKSSSAPSSKYGNLDVPSPRNNRPSIESRESSIAPQPEEAYGSGRPPIDRAASTNSSLLGGSSGQAGTMQAPLQPNRPRGASASSGNNRSKRDSLMPFGGGGSGGGLFRRASKLAPSQASTSPAQERQEYDGGLAGHNVQQSGSQHAVDAEGYSVPPAGYDRQPWDNANGAGASSNLMDDDDDDAGAQSLAPGLAQPSKLTNMAIAPATVQETEDERRAALESVKSTLLSSSGTSTVAGASLNRRATRGRRDVRSTTYNPTIPDDVPLAQVIAQQRSRESSADGTALSSTAGLSPTSPSTAAFGGERANSMLSTMSGGVTRNGLGTDPFEHATSPGLRAAFVETVNVLSKGGEPGRVMVTGEIMLSHRVDSRSDTSTTGTRIRIANFEQFEKAAPNPAYLSPMADSPGEYLILPSLARALKTVTVLKYQLHIAPGTESAIAPITVKALWKCEPGQTRVILNYSANASSALRRAGEQSPFGEDEEVKLEHVQFVVPMSAPVTTFQAKPAATLSSDKTRLTFQIDPITIGAPGDAANGKLLASLTTEGTAVPQPVSVTWRSHGRTVSQVGIELTGPGLDSVEEVHRQTVSGKFLAAP